MVNPLNFDPRPGKKPKLPKFLEEYFTKQEEALAAWDNGEEESDFVYLEWNPPITDQGMTYSSSWSVCVEGLKAPEWFRKLGYKPRPLESRNDRGYGFVRAAEEGGICNSSYESPRTFRLGHPEHRYIGDAAIKAAKDNGWTVEDTGWQYSSRGGAKLDKKGKNRLPVFQVEYRRITLFAPRKPPSGG